MSLGDIFHFLQQRQTDLSAQPWWQEYAQAEQAMRMSGDYQAFSNTVNKIASQYPSADLTKLGDTAGKAIQSDQSNHSGGLTGVPMVDRYMDHYAPQTALAIMAAATGGALAGAGAGAGAGAEGGVLGGGASALGDAGVYGVSGIESAAAPGLTGTAGAGATGSGVSGAAASGGGGMWDWLDDFSSLSDAGDAGAYGQSGIESASAPTGLGGDQVLDMFGSTPDMPGWTNNASTWDPAFSQPGGSSLWGNISDWAKGALPGIKSLFGGGSAAAGGSKPGGGMSFGTAAFDSTPFLLSLGLANKQRNDINPYLDRLNSLYDRFSSNEGGYLNSVTDPYDMATSAQYGNLRTGLGNRGLSGSSFGDQSLDNFNYMRDVGRGDLLSRAINESVGAQSQLTDQAMKGINARNAGTNALLGSGLNASARLFSPQIDPFGLRALMGGG